ncbi:MAG: hypothetical protein RIB80_04805 [Rhodospirillales bacterium]
MKTPTHVICPDLPDLPSYLTAGKQYRVLGTWETRNGLSGADILCDHDFVISVRTFGGCGFLNGADWIPVYADEESMVEAQSVTTWADVGPGLLEALRECREYFDQRADADQPSGLQPIPNEEATILVGIDAAIASAEKVESHE